jgi:hypothetical protein
VSTEAEIQEAIGQGFFVQDFLRTQGGINFDCFIQRVGEFTQFVGNGRFTRSGSALSGMAAVRGAYNNAVNTAPSWFEPLLREYSDIMDFPDKATTLIMQALYANFIKTGKRVKSRNFTFDTVHATGTPYGSGTIYRCTKDENGFDIENTFVQTISIECTNDQNNGGTKFKESFRFKGGTANIDNIVIAGENADETFPGISSDDSGSYFQNCSFSSANGEDELLFDGWTLDVDDLADWTQDTTVYFQITPGDPVAASLKITGNGNIYQLFGNTQFAGATPFVIRVPLLLSGVNAGALFRLRFGEQIADYIATGAEADWVFVLIEMTDRCWYNKFAKDGGMLKLEVHGMSAGTAWADNILTAPFQPFSGLWYAPCAGETPFKKGDSYYFTDEAEDDAIIQRCLVQYTGVYLPHDNNLSAITWDEPVFHT